MSEDAPTVKIPILELPDDPVRVAKLKKKLKAYDARAITSGLFVPGAYILRELLARGRFTLIEATTSLKVLRPTIKASGHRFITAWQIIWSYCTDGVAMGRPLPELTEEELRDATGQQ